jgi:hypothetical protein
MVNNTDKKLVKKYAEEIRVAVARYGAGVPFRRFEAAISCALGASHAQRTRKENEALESARVHVGPIGMQAVKDALKRARNARKSGK